MPLPRPPSADPLVALADQCVQCGLCLPTCPTYRVGRIEAESPRGRIALARGWALEALEPTDTGDAHLDACLACRSCEAVCPAGVRYGALLVEVRTRQRARRRRPWRQYVVEALLRRPRALAAAVSLYRMFFRGLPTVARPLPRPRAAPRPMAQQPATAESGRRSADLFIGCIARHYEPKVRHALLRLLAACDVDLVEPAAQACCGALHAHAGAAGDARALARRNTSAFAGATTVLTLASGCHESVANALPPGVAVDAIEFLAGQGEPLRLHPSTARVALHLPCTQRNVVRSVPALRRLLERVPGLEIVELDAGFGCCGAAGTAMLTSPERAATFRAPLISQIEAAGVDVVLSANIGCRLHLANGTTVPVLHPLEFLADRLDGVHAHAQ